MNTFNITDNCTAVDRTSGGGDRFGLLAILIMLVTPFVHLTMRSESLIRFFFTVVMGTFAFAVLGIAARPDKNEQAKDLGTLVGAYIVGALYGLFLSRIYEARIAREAAQPITFTTDPSNLREQTDVENNAQGIVTVQTAAPAQISQFDAARQTRSNSFSDVMINDKPVNATDIQSGTGVGRGRKLEHA